ncbi:DUF418 domain-containing protein [Olivibacter domesticus]
MIDILRGFALYGIILAHIGSIYLYELEITSNDLTGMDNKLKKLLELFIERKFYLIFSLLFGLSFSIQLQNAINRNKPFVLKYCWRLSLLFFIGFIHNQLYPFDILQIYAFIGVLLLPIRKIATPVLLAISISLFIFSCVFLQFDGHIKDSLSTLRIQKVSLSQTLTHQIASGHFFMILSLFTFGLWAGKKNIFTLGRIDPAYFKSLFIFSLISLLILKIAHNQFSIPSFSLPLVNISFSFLYISIISLSYIYLPHLKLLWQSLEVVGRMGLTNYILQTIFFYILFLFKSILFNGGDLYLLFIYANSFFFFQILFSIWWLKKHKQGPLEWIWRSATDLYRVTNLYVKDKSLCDTPDQIKSPL